MQDEKRKKEYRVYGSSVWRFHYAHTKYFGMKNKEIEANAKGLPPVVYDKPEDAYYEQYFACPLTYL